MDTSNSARPGGLPGLQPQCVEYKRPGTTIYIFVYNVQPAHDAKHLIQAYSLYSFCENVNLPQARVACQACSGLAAQICDCLPFWWAAKFSTVSWFWRPVCGLAAKFVTALHSGRPGPPNVRLSRGFCCPVGGLGAEI